MKYLASNGEVVLSFQGLEMEDEFHDSILVLYTMIYGIKIINFSYPNDTSIVQHTVLEFYQPFFQQLVSIS